MFTYNKIIYIGAGLHLEPLKHFNSTNEFIFVDTLPRSEFDTCNFNEGFYHKNFHLELIKKAKEYDFKLEKVEELEPKYYVNILSLTQRIKWVGIIKETFPNICPKLITFYNYNTEQKLKYYISTNILYNICVDLKNDIRTSTGLIISGYHPHKKILNYIIKPINLYCYDKTAYKLEDNQVDDLNNLIYWMFKNLTMVKKYFSNIYMVDEENGFITEYSDIVQLDNELKNRIKITL